LLAIGLSVEDRLRGNLSNKRGHVSEDLGMVPTYGADLASGEGLGSHLHGRAIMIVGHGIDLVDVTAFEKLLAEATGDFLARCFTSEEQATAGDGPNRSERLASRFAAKEAVLKVLGTGFGGGIGFLHIEIRKESSGAPSVVLHGPAEARARELGVSRWLISTSHEGGLAIASAIAIAS
jgi:holo-[acyl-carrier protein] synthase